MKLLKRTALASLLGAGIVASAAAAPAYKLYVPGAKNADVKKDMEAQNVTLADDGTHFSFLEAEGGRKVLLLNTLDGKNAGFSIPLAGSEKKVTMIFKARGDVDPDNATTPFGILWASVQNGAYQSVLRHNASNQLKGSTGQTSLKPRNIVSDWHEFRLVYDTTDGKKYTATAFVDGVQLHQTKDYEKRVNVSEPLALTDDGTWAGEGKFALFGDNDNSTNGYARYAWFLVVTDEDVSGKSLAQLSSAAGYDLAATPKITNDKVPPSHRPSHKPADINMVGSDFPEMENPKAYKDPSEIKKGRIDLNCLPYSKAKAQKVSEKVKAPKMKFAATADSSLKKDDPKKGRYKTIAAAIEAVEPGSAIEVKPGLYHEKLLVTKPGIKLIGSNPARTIIYGYEADTGGINGNLLVEVNLLPAGTNTEPGAKSDGSGAVDPDKATFSAVNITFYNKGAEWNKTWGYTERRSIALALKGVQKCYLENCLFLGQQDTLYWRSGRVYAKNCYIEGEVDFICGGATALFDECHIYSLVYKNGGYITAAAPADTANPATAQFAKGYVFRNCLIDSDPDMSMNVFLGRGAWNGGSATKAQAKVAYLNCELSGHIDPDGWKDWDQTNTVEKAFFREYKSTGEGSINKEYNKRKFMTDAEYEKDYSSTEKILGYKPEL